MPFTKTIALGAVAAVVLGAPLPASAAIKWLTCQLYDSTKNRVVHLNSPYPTGGTINADLQYEGFLKAARHQNVIDEASKTEGACIVSNSEDEALGGVNGFVKHFKDMGAREATIGFAPS